MERNITNKNEASQAEWEEMDFDKKMDEATEMSKPKYSFIEEDGFIKLVEDGFVVETFVPKEKSWGNALRPIMPGLEISSLTYEEVLEITGGVKPNRFH